MNYEVSILTTTDKYQEKALARWQADGWEVAGEVVVRPDDSRGILHIYVPMKRALPEPEAPSLLEGGGGL